MLVQSDHYRSDKVSSHQFDHLDNHQGIASSTPAVNNGIMESAANIIEGSNNNGSGNFIPITRLPTTTISPGNHINDDGIDKSVAATIDQLLARIDPLKKILSNHFETSTQLNQHEHNNLFDDQSNDCAKPANSVKTNDKSTSNEGSLAMDVQDDTSDHLLIDDKLPSPEIDKSEVESKQQQVMNHEDQEEQPKFHELVPSPNKKLSELDDAQGNAVAKLDESQTQPVQDTSESTIVTNITQASPELVDNSQPRQKNATSARKRVKREDSQTESNDEEQQPGGRAKRQRVQTKLFQIVDTPTRSNKRNREDLLSSETSATSQDEWSPVKKPRKSTTSTAGANNTMSSRKRKRSNSSATSKASKSPQASQSTSTQEIPQLGGFLNIVDSHFIKDVIHYDKNDFLAIRNEENTFYLAQLAETVRSAKPNMKVRWLDTEDNGKTYFITNQYDQIPQKSIIMPVDLNKLKSDKKHNYYSMDDEVKENVLERLSKSIIVSNDKDSSGSQS